MGTTHILYTKNAQNCSSVKVYQQEWKAVLHTCLLHCNVYTDVRTLRKYIHTHPFSTLYESSYIMTCIDVVEEANVHVYFLSLSVKPHFHALHASE